MKIGHLFLSIFEFKKKVLKKNNFVIFSISPKSIRKNTKRSSEIENSIFFYKNRVFGGSFDNFLEKISIFSNKNIKTSSKIALFVFAIVIFHFSEDLFVRLRDFLFRGFPKKTSVFAAFIVRRFKKNE